DEPGIGGTVKAGDFEGAKDQTDDAHLYLDRFSAFMKMLYKLEEKYGIQYSLTLKVLPEVAGFSKHLKADDKPRCIAEVHFLHRGQHFILLEVDTSDNANRLSTQLLTIKDMNCWEENYEKLRKFVVQKTLNWPHSFIKKIAVQQARFNHPRIEKHGQQVAIEDLESWANRIYLGLNR
ncbi:Tn7-like element transposition protein TnsE, partial [Acinetobacter baumannii]|nr:Tn7-like element transposition protein TnsE [Acinetobacter baumannii]